MRVCSQRTPDERHEDTEAAACGGARAAANRPRAGPLSTVDVWHADLTGADRGRCEAVLSADERERAARLARPAPWIAARAALRLVLARRLDVAPAAVELAVTAHGKPWLPGSRVRFNLAHSGERALIAVAEDVEVGVDIERLSRSSRAVERALTPGERAALGEDRHTELLRVWCRKEALAKAIGGGLGWAPERFDTTAAGGYALVDLDLGPGYVGAVAVAGERPRVALHPLILPAP